jgi:hypothetical protein
MFRFIDLCLGTLVRLLRARRSLLLENLALRQQLTVLKRRHPRPRLDLFDKLFWVSIRHFWSAWQQSLIAVTPESVTKRDHFLQADLPVLIRTMPNWITSELPTNRPQPGSAQLGKARGQLNMALSNFIQTTRGRVFRRPITASADRPLNC